MKRQSLSQAKQLGINGKIERHPRSHMQLRNIAKRRHARLPREIWRHSQPGEKRGQPRIETASFEFPSQRLPLEIDRRKHQRLRDRNARNLQTLTLPGLRRE